MEIKVSDSEILDKYTILSIKKEKISDKDKLKNIEYEYDKLTPYFLKLVVNSEIEDLYNLLYQINEKLWDIEDKLRIKEKLGEFDDDFIQLARLVYFTNDDRSKYKKEINILTNSSLIEEKSYEKY